ncbi:MAG TPA: exo-beta-N-acetylmuramidase NamZ domain-containing protein, partial [Longimicrobiales bacterium]|nr:exo-beta-N-acetylmuramidase NamZ domain-containing protein [Longimicrobiales bacterium]
MQAANIEVTDGDPRRQRAADSFPRTAAGLIPVLLAGWSLACAPAPGVEGQAGTETDGTVRTGLDVLVRDGAGPLAGRRVGLITNHTGIDASGRSTIDILHDHPDLDLVALFSPEHAITGRAAPGEHVESGHDPRTG